MTYGRTSTGSGASPRTLPTPAVLLVRRLSGSVPGIHFSSRCVTSGPEPVSAREQRDAVAAGALRPVHRGIRTVHEIGDVVSGLHLRDSHAGGDARLHAHTRDRGPLSL